MRAFISIKSVGYYKALFIGTFITTMLGVALIGIVALAISATQHIPSSSLGPQVTLTTQQGISHTFSRDALDVQGIATALGLGAVISGFMTITGVTSACSFAIALRRRDLGLFRLFGMDGKQMRRMILGEAATTAIPAAILGCVIAAWIAPLAINELNHTALVPVPLPEHGGLLPLIIAYVIGLALALIAAYITSRRATKVRPAEALRDAVIDTKIMTKGRWTVGLITAGAGIFMALSTPFAGASNATALAIFGTIAFTVAAVMLAPVYLPWISRLLIIPMRLIDPSVGRLAVASIATSRRRTSLLIAPVLSIIAVTGIILGIMETTSATSIVDQEAHTKSQLVALSTRHGLDAQTLQRITNAKDVTAVAASAPVKVAFIAPGRAVNTPSGNSTQNAFGQSEAAAMDLKSLAEVQHVEAVEGSLSSLTSDEIAVREEFISWYGVHVGSTMQIGFFDGRHATVHVAAIIKGGAALPEIILSPTLAKNSAVIPQYASILVKPGAAEAVRQQLQQIPGTQTITTQDWYKRNAQSQEALQQLALFILVVPASIFALIAIANALIMAYSRRGREIASMTLLGISPNQLRRIVFTEAFLVVGLGVSIAALFVAIGLYGYLAALRSTYLAVQFRLPWIPLLGLVTACLIVSILTSLLALLHLRSSSAISSIATRE